MTPDEKQALGYAIAILRNRLDVEASHNAAIIRGYINALAALRSRPAPPEPRINTPCPSCGSSTLFVGEGGHLTCSLIGCKQPVVGRAIEELRRSRPVPPDDLVRAVEAVLDHDDTHDTLHGTGLAEMLRAALASPAPVAVGVPEGATKHLAPVAAPAPETPRAYAGPMGIFTGMETPAPVDVPACPDGQHSYRRNAPPQNGDVCFVCRKSIWWETPAPDAMPEIQVGDRIGWRHRQTGEVFDTPERRHRVGVPQAWPHGGDEVCELLSIERNGVVIWRRQEAQP